MRNIFVTSDTHYNHANMLKFKRDDGSHLRVFRDVREMNETLIENWNKVVRDEDIIYHLGDVYMSDGAGCNEILKRLRGRKRLVLGNHDNGKDQILQRHFQKITVWRMWPDLGLILSHVPLHPSSFRKARVNVHGHTHYRNVTVPTNRNILDRRYLNVCVEQTNYTPVNIEDIDIEWLE